MYENEYVLYHYGVKGMKWGVRRDARILANHRYNAESKRLKTAYDWGMIDSEKYSDGIRKANARRKQSLADMENSFRNAKSDAERERLGKNITKMAVNEVPDIKIQRGAAVANQLIGGAGIAKTAYTTAALSVLNPTFAAAYLGAGVVTTAAQTGLSWVGRRYLDTLS